ncbi:MAG: aldehyde dehydrogenase family protein, partial [Gammaproteobacteria bacterium]|nr:aldehyde dehydrogenase family protein [Gammaproteobacteria bacterium]
MSAKAADTRVPVAKTYKIYIGGKFPRTESGRFYVLKEKSDAVLANVSHASRKDFREAVVAARAAFSGWSASSAYLRGQILYRIAEMLEGRRAQFVTELAQQGIKDRKAEAEVTATIDRLIYFAGWADKY